MRFSVYKSTVFLSYSLIFWLVLLTINIIYEERRENEMLLLLSEIKKIDDVKYFQPLPGTNGQWTMFDIRKGKVSPGKEVLGVIDENFASDLAQVDRIQPSSVNRTRKSHILVYNRVPKCASTTMQNILRRLSRKNKFRVEHSPIYWRYTTFFHLDFK